MEQNGYEREFQYVRLSLENSKLDVRSRALLSAIGVECLDDGGEYEAYGIVPSRRSMSEIIRRLPGIKAVDYEEPPCGK